jgi:nitrogen regulatory protein PII
MKAVMIIYNIAHTEKLEFVLERLGIKGYTQWENVKGSGSLTGVPHLGTHTWPEINGVVLTFVQEEKVMPLTEAVKKIDEINTEVGIRAFVWDVQQAV